MQATKFVSLFFVFLIFLVTILPSEVLAYNGWFFWKEGENYEQELNEIKYGLDALESDSRKMRFIYKNMIDTGIDVVKIEIIKDSRNTLKTYYVVCGEGILDENEVSENITKDNSTITFKPTLRQVKQGLGLLEDEKVTFSEIIRATMLYQMVEKENEPKLSEIISKLDRDMFNSLLPISFQRVEQMLS